MRWHFVAFTGLVSAFLVGCEGQSPSIAQTSKATTAINPPPAPTPTPISPKEARLDASAAFIPSQDQYGDPIETLHIDISSNIPLVFELVPTLYVNGQAQLTPNHCAWNDPVGECIVDHGRTQMEVFWKKRAPAGQYRLEMVVYSYSSESPYGPGQEARYQAWVGHLGQTLAGNPLAVVDRKHPAILNLRKEIVFSH